MSFEGKNLYGQYMYIDYSEKKKWPKGFICPYTGTIFYNIRIYSRSQVSVYRTIGPLVLCRYTSNCRAKHKHVFIMGCLWNSVSYDKAPFMFLNYVIFVLFCLLHILILHWMCGN